MVSNGLSRRRRVLKRPLVCKSPKPGLCGMCTLEIQKPPDPTGANQVEPYVLLFACDPNPTDETFMLTVQGAFTPDVPLPPVPIGIPTSVLLRSPLTLGLYTITFTLTNSTKCVYFNSVEMTVA